MPVATAVKANLERSSWIRRMFEDGRALKAEFGEENVYDFSLGNPDLEPPKAFLDALKDAVGSPEQGMHAYMPNAGFPSARAAMAEKISSEHGVAASAEDVILTVGAAGALNVVLKTVLNPGDEVVVIRPYFAEYGFYISNHGGVMRTVDAAPDFSLDPGAVAAALGPQTAAVIINTPNNPSGRVYDRPSLEKLAAVLSAHGQACGRAPYLILDEPYRDIVYDGLVAPPVIDAYPESIVVSSFSKTLSIPGERLGYVGVNPAIADKAMLMAGLTMANRILGFVNAPALVQRAAAASWKARADVARYERRRTMLAGVLRIAQIEYAKPEGAFYLFCKVPEGGPASAGGRDVAFAMHLKGFHILAVPGEGFGYPGWFRLSYCVPERTIEDSAVAWAEAVRIWRSI
ncbi:MAG: pyridoxal phosphate-dependent aminotransferase [Spirochaetia bacterium]|nr:pyridoxal phosphate-dependent aminotransferase [Spirochaetia bacterium]